MVQDVFYHKYGAERWWLTINTTGQLRFASSVVGKNILNGGEWWWFYPGRIRQRSPFPWIRHFCTDPSMAWTCIFLTIEQRLTSEGGKIRTWKTRRTSIDVYEGLNKGNQWLISPDHKAGSFGGVYVRVEVGWPVMIKKACGVPGWSIEYSLSEVKDQKNEHFLRRQNQGFGRWETIIGPDLNLYRRGWIGSLKIVSLGSTRVGKSFCKFKALKVFCIGKNDMSNDRRIPSWWFQWNHLKNISHMGSFLQGSGWK